MHCHFNAGIMWLVASIEYSCLNCLVAGGFGWGDVRCERPRVRDTETSHPGQSWAELMRDEEVKSTFTLPHWRPPAIGHAPLSSSPPSTNTSHAGNLELCTLLN